MRNAKNIQYGRQDPSPFLTLPPPGTAEAATSFDYWWPYPPAVTSSSSAEQPDGTGSVDSELLSDQPTSNMSSSFTASGPTPLTPSSVISPAGNNTSTSSISFVTLTALPPVTTSFSPSHINHAVSTSHKPFNPLLLTPIFAVFGLIMGMACGWYGYEFWKRRKERQMSTLGGPRYNDIEYDKVAHAGPEDELKVVAAQNVSDEKCTDKQSQQMLENVSIVRITSPHRREGAEESGLLPMKAERPWTKLGLPALLRTPLLAGYLAGAPREHSDDHHSHTLVEKTLNSFNSTWQFLTTEPNAGTDNRNNSPTNARSPSAPTVFSSVATEDEDEDEDSYDDARRYTPRSDSIRHKSIRRRIAEKIQMQFSPRQGFVRYKARARQMNRGRTPELEEGAYIPTTEKRRTFIEGSSNVKRTKSQAYGSVSGHGRAKSNFTLTDQVLQTPSKVVNKCTSSRLPSVDDKYTPLPDRRVRKMQEVRKSRLRADLEAEPVLNSDADAYVLPASPPRISTPRLESELLFSPDTFTAPVSQYFSPTKLIKQSHIAPETTLDQRPDSPPVSPLESDSSIRRGPIGPRQPAKTKTRSTRGDYYRDSSEPLPSPYRTSRDKTLPPSPPRRSTRRFASNGPSSSRNTLRRQSSGNPMSPKQRYEARRTALDKVDAIVSRSWSTRKLNGGSPPSSPTMFGAQGSAGDSGLYGALDDIAEDAALGIEQRLDKSTGPARTLQ